MTAVGIAVGAAVGVALAARLAYLVRRPLWFDELFTLWISRRTPGDIVRALRLDSGPPFFYFVEKPFVALAEALRADAVARALPFLALAALFLAGLRRETAGGTRFALLLAASPTLFFYSAEARAYGVLAALGFLLFVSVFRLRRSPWAGAAAVFSAGLLPWIHYLGVFVVAGSIVVTLLRRKFRLAVAQGAALLPYLLWVPVAVAQPAGAIAWSEETWGGTLRRSLGVFGSWAEPAPYFTAFRLPAPSIGALIGAALVVGTAVMAWRDRAVRDALAFSALPMLGAAAAGFWRPVYFAGRTEMAILPVALWAFARAARRNPALRTLTTLSIAAGMVTIAASLLAIPPLPPYATTARRVVDAARPRDLVVASDADYLPLRLASDRGRLRAPLLGIPAEIENHPGWFEPGKLRTPDPERTRLEGFMQSGRTGALVYLALPPDPAAQQVALGAVRETGARLVSADSRAGVVIVSY